MQTNLALHLSGFTISGKYFTVSNGFFTRAHGEVKLHYADLLSVRFVRLRNKRLFYGMLLGGGVFVFVEQLAEFWTPATLSIPIIAICTFGALYLFSARRYVEITSMKGTFLVPLPPEDTELPAIATKLQKHISAQ
jgi:hypothetical protein